MSPKDDQVSFSEPIDSLQFDLNLKLLKLATSRPGPPNIVSDAQFPVKAARLMYQSLFGGFSKCLSNARNIYWLPSDHLKDFPISSLLVRDTDESQNAVPGNGLGGLPWFVKDHAVTLLPSVVSLLTNSNTHGFTRYDLEFAGVGNPVLEGLGATDFAVELATRASGGMLEKLDQLAPLPNTEAELLTIAGEFESSQLFLASDATEINVRNKLNSGVESISFATP